MIYFNDSFNDLFNQNNKHQLKFESDIKHFNNHSDSMSIIIQNYTNSTKL